MATRVNNFEGRLLRVFDRTVGRRSGGNAIVATATPEWDSLTHIKLVMELENEFHIEVPPGDIQKLFSEFGVVLNYVRDAVGDD
ncbi:MAG: acyl carrier protein [Phycisphaerae bacterium]|nr:acyl carrier protein [Phycisphaerae bacterium]